MLFHPWIHPSVQSQVMHGVYVRRGDKDDSVVTDEDRDIWTS